MRHHRTKASTSDFTRSRARPRDAFDSVRFRSIPFDPFESIRSDRRARPRRRRRGPLTRYDPPPSRLDAPCQRIHAHTNAPAPFSRRHRRRARPAGPREPVGLHPRHGVAAPGRRAARRPVPRRALGRRPPRPRGRPGLVRRGRRRGAATRSSAWSRASAREARAGHSRAATGRTRDKTSTCPLRARGGARRARM